MTTSAAIEARDYRIGTPRAIAYVLAVAALLLLAIPALAFAADIFGIEDALREAITANLAAADENVREINGSMLPNSFQAIMGNSSANTPAAKVLSVIATTVMNGFALPTGSAILTLATLVQLIRVAERADGSATLPGIRDVIKIFVFLAVFVFLLQNSWGIVKAIFDDSTVAWTSMAVNTPTLRDTAFELPKDAGLGELLVYFITSYLVKFCVSIAYILTFVVCFARNIQVYFYAMFSPVPIAFLAADETRQIGIGFLKGYFGLVLAYAATALILTLFPYLFNIMVALPGISPAIAAVPGCLLMLYLLYTSGNWTQGLLGG